MDAYTSLQPDLDAIARNLTALELAHLTPEEAADYEHELSVIASLNEALEITTTSYAPPTRPNAGIASIPCYQMQPLYSAAS